MDNRIYNMKLHEEICDGGFFIFRVAGGWIYYNNYRSLFVPFHNEFQEVPSANPN